MSRKRIGLAVVALCAVAAGLPSLALAANSASLARKLGTSIADAVDKVMPSVVVVRTEATRYRVARDIFFGVWGIPERIAGQGSGVIISKDGYVLTNGHVIEDAQEIEIVLNDETKYPARLVGKDPHTDIAVVKIEDANGRDFQPIELGDSNDVRVGEFVIAIGSPFSLSSSVTLGIVSQKGRQVGQLLYEDFIQSDAAVNQGNSGGPLVDVDGRMVGVNTMIQTAGFSGGNIGISFAIPVNLAMTVAESIMKNGKWVRPWLGISMEQTASGVRVGKVERGSPAAAVGLRAGDIIKSIDGRAVERPKDVQMTVLKRGVGEKVKLAADRDGKSILFEVVTDTMPPLDMIGRE